MIRRYVYNQELDRVVEIEMNRLGVAEFRKLDIRKTREGALERADRREWSHNKFGTELRWKE